MHSFLKARKRAVPYLKDDLVEGSGVMSTSENGGGGGGAEKGYANPTYDDAAGLVLVNNDELEQDHGGTEQGHKPQTEKQQLPDIGDEL